MPVPVKVPYRQHFVFDEALGLDVREGFAFNSKIFAGVQPSSWQRDLLVWNFRRGRYGGLEVKENFQRAVPINLRIDGATEETDGVDPLLRTTAGSHLALCEVGYADDPVATPTAIEFRLYSCADGSYSSTFVPYVPTITIPCPFTFSAGSSMLWARCVQGDEVELRAGQWSAVKVRCGSGSFGITSGACPSPGGALYAKNTADAEVSVVTGNVGTYRVPFDVMASSVSASCVTHTDIVLNAGATVDVVAGSQIMGVLRASRSGPQAALYVLNTDLTARLLALTAVFSNGLCECGKADHHAADVTQGPDGRLYLLNECSLHVYAPDGPTVSERLPGTPGATGGDPGGQCLRWSEGIKVFLTELLVAKPKDMGFYYYNRLILRLAGRDQPGCGTIWEGPGAIETFKGKLWGIRGGLQDLAAEGAKVYLDSISAGAWQNGGVAFKATNYWRQLRARGAQLWMFGLDDGGAPDFQPGGVLRDSTAGTLDTPITAVWGTDGKIRFADFPFLVRRVTPGAGTLVCVCNDTVTAQGFKNNGHSLRIIELPTQDGATGTGTGATRICAFWNTGSSEFRMTQSAFTAAGGNISKLPPYLAWLPLSGRNGGGVWQSSLTLPSSPYLALDASGGSLIRYHLTGTLPYSADTWGVLCFEIYSDGSVGVIGSTAEPQPTVGNAGDALADMPAGSQFRVLQNVPPLSGTTSVVQVTDPSRDGKFVAEREVYPTLWARVDSSAALSDLTTYTQLVRYGREQSLSATSQSKVEVVLLVTPDNLPFDANELPILQRRYA